jgi:APA family basic amino acid/polyamine antiporter
MKLQREVGVFGATMMGLGSIIGTGVFVSIGIAAGIAGPAVVFAIVAAGVLAMCNALNSAQLAANHPVSGGTYEYGYKYLNPLFGFTAGWMFVCAKVASAATAALGLTGYLLNMLGQDSRWQSYVAVGAVVGITAIVLSGIRLSSRVNVVIVSITLVALASFVIGGAPAVSLSRLRPDWEPLSFFHASALMFVAYTGYGRIATLGEEVLEPRRTIPRAIMATLVISTVIYIAVAVVGVGAAGSEALSAAAVEEAATLEVVARDFPLRVHGLVAIGAMTAMLGVLLNLVLGISRVLLAMGRRRDLPKATENLVVAVVITGILIAILAATGSVRTTWSFSAFTVLVYYWVTNLAALQLQEKDRLYSRWWAYGGLAGCLVFGFSLDWEVWTAGLAVLGVGLVWHGLRRRFAVDWNSGRDTSQ